jgi:tRNA (adenine57-N1/adenine58-N1)-methyltransferase
MSAVFLDGEKALFIDSKKRRYLVTLNIEGEFHSHSGFVPHTSIIGQKPGIVAETTKGAKYIVLRPTLEDFVI